MRLDAWVYSVLSLAVLISSFITLEFGFCMPCPMKPMPNSSGNLEGIGNNAGGGMGNNASIDDPTSAYKEETAGSGEEEQVEEGGFRSVGDQTQPGAQETGLGEEREEGGFETVSEQTIPLKDPPVEIAVVEEEEHGGFESLSDETRSGSDKSQELAESEEEEQGGFRSEEEGETRRRGEAPQEIVRQEQEINGHCHELEGLFWAAIDVDNLSHASLTLEKAKDCPFYGRSMGILQDRKNLLCMKFEGAVLSACLDQDLKRAQNLLEEARSWGCLISQDTHNFLQEQMAFQQRQQERNALDRSRKQNWSQFWNDLQMWQSELMQEWLRQPQRADRDKELPPAITRRPPQQDMGQLAGDWEQHGNYFVIRISRQGMFYVGQMLERYPKKTQPYGYSQGETVLEVEFAEGDKYVGKYKALTFDRRTQRTVKNWAQAEVHYSAQYDQFSVSFHNDVTAANFSGGKGHQDFRRYKPVSKGKSRHNTGFK